MINKIKRLRNYTSRKIPIFVVDKIYLILWRASFLFGYIKYLIFNRGGPSVKSCGILKISRDEYLNSVSNISNGIQASLKQIKSDFSNEIKNSPRAFHLSTFDYLQEETYPDILKIISSSEIINLGRSYLKTEPILHDISVYTNFARSDLPVEGSKLWHRDDKSYHRFEIYINLSDISNNSGPLYISMSENTSRFTIPDYRVGSGWSDGMRFNDSDLSKYFGEDIKSRLTSNIGGEGLCVYLDSGFNFHRGGYTTKGTRTVMRVVYGSTIHSTTLASNFNNNFKNFLLKSQNNSKKSFSKYSNPSKMLKRIKYVHLSSQNQMILAYMKMQMLFRKFIYQSMKLFIRAK